MATMHFWLYHRTVLNFYENFLDYMKYLERFPSGHFVIVPLEHINSLTEMDEDVIKILNQCVYI